jgi:hypothetical protein
MSGAEPQRAYHEDGYYEQRADGLLASARDGTEDPLGVEGVRHLHRAPGDYT